MTDPIRLVDEVEARAEFAKSANVDAMIAAGGGREWHTSYIEDVPRLASALRELHAENHDLGVMYRCGIARIEQLEEELERKDEVVEAARAYVQVEKRTAALPLMVALDKLALSSTTEEE